NPLPPRSTTGCCRSKYRRDRSLLPLLPGKAGGKPRRGQEKTKSQGRASRGEPMPAGDGRGVAARPRPGSAGEGHVSPKPLVSKGHGLVAPPRNGGATNPGDPV